MNQPQGFARAASTTSGASSSCVARLDFRALWFYRRDQLIRSRWGARAAHSAGVAGALASILGLSTGPCSVVGCGAPVIPVVGLAFVGLPSGTLKFLAELSSVVTVVVLLMMRLGVAYFGWPVSTNPRGAARATDVVPTAPFGHGQSLDELSPDRGIHPLSRIDIFALSLLRREGPLKGF